MDVDSGRIISKGGTTRYMGGHTAIRVHGGGGGGHWTACSCSPWLVWRARRGCRCPPPRTPVHLDRRVRIRASGGRIMYIFRIELYRPTVGSRGWHDTIHARPTASSDRYTAIRVTRCARVAGVDSLALLSMASMAGRTRMSMPPPPSHTGHLDRRETTPG
jgi:hypothetical protein